MFPIDFNFLTADDVYDVSDSQDYVKKNDTFETWRQKTNWLIQKNTREIVLGTETSGNYVATIAGTTNQVNVSGSGTETAGVTLSLPQSIGTTSSPTFGSLVITNGIQSGSVTTSGLTTTGTLSSGGATFTGNTSAVNLTVSNTFTASNGIVTPSITASGTNTLQIGKSNFTGAVTVKNSLSVADQGGTFYAWNSSANNLTVFNEAVIQKLSANGTNTGSLSVSGATTLFGSLTGTTGTFSGNVSITGSGSSLTVDSGTVSLKGNTYSFPASIPTSANNYLKLNGSNQLTWEPITVQASNIVLEDVVPIGVIVKWDDTTTPNDKWVFCTGQLISGLSGLTTAEKNELLAIYTSNLPTLSGYIIKAKKDDVVDYRVTLGSGLTGLKAGSSVSTFDARSQAALTTGDRAEVTLLIKKDSTLSFNGSNELGVASGQFLSLTSGGTVAAQSKFTGGSTVSTSANTGYVLVGTSGTATHIAIDKDTIQAKGTGGNTSGTLYVNYYGGNVNFGNGSNTSNLIVTGKITAQDPTDSQHVVTKSYMDTNTVSSTGDTLTGFLTLHADPTNVMHAVTKQYVDNNTVSSSGDTMTGRLTIQNADVTLSGASGNLVVGTTSGAHIAVDNNSVQAKSSATAATLLELNVLGGNVQIGHATLSVVEVPAVPSTDNSVVNKKYLDDNTVSAYGDTMYGKLTLASDPTEALHAATKQYVDNSLGVVNLKFSVDMRTGGDLINKNVTTAQGGFGTNVLSWQRGYFDSNGNWQIGTNLTDYDDRQQARYSATKGALFKIFYNKDVRGENNPYRYLEVGHWIPCHIPSVLAHTYQQITNIDPNNGWIIFTVPTTSLPASLLSAVVKDTTTGTNFQAFQATIDIKKRAVIVSQYDDTYKTSSDGILCMVNLMSDYALPYNSKNASIHNIAVTSTFSNFSNATGSSTMPTLRRMNDYLLGKYQKYTNPFWANGSLDNISEDQYAFDYKTIPLGIGSATRYAVIDITAEKATLFAQVSYPTEYVSFSSFNYNWSSDYINPLGGWIGKDIADDSMGMTFGTTVIVASGSKVDYGYAYWNPNTNRYAFSKGGSAERFSDKVLNPLSLYDNVQWFFGNEGDGPYGFWAKNTTDGKFIVRTTNSTTGKHKIYVLTFRNLPQDGKSKNISFSGGKFYRYYNGTTTEITTGIEVFTQP